MKNKKNTLNCFNLGLNLITHFYKVLKKETRIPYTPRRRVTIKTGK